MTCIWQSVREEAAVCRLRGYRHVRPAAACPGVNRYLGNMRFRSSWLRAVLAGLGKNLRSPRVEHWFNRLSPSAHSVSRSANDDHPPRSCKRLAILVALSAAIGCSAFPSQLRSANTNPETARIISDDIPRFWAAFDKMTSASDTLPLRVDYLDRGTDGLKDFTNVRWKNARTLAAMIWPIRAYYASVRQNTLSVAALEPQLRRAYRALDSLYDDAVFPDVYLAIGGMSTGGTTSDRGLLIGTEMFTRAPDSPVSVLSPWGQSVVKAADILPAIIAHELTHYEQKYSTNVSSLLAQSIREGSADFVSELLTGRTINETIKTYGDAHESEVWSDFSAAMNGSDISRWLYNGGTITASTTRPADLGYYVGYRITQAYYAKQSDKRRALKDILQIGDFTKFLQASGYGADL